MPCGPGVFSNVSSLRTPGGRVVGNPSIGLVSGGANCLPLNGCRQVVGSGGVVGGGCCGGGGISDGGCGGGCGLPPWLMAAQYSNNMCCPDPFFDPFRRIPPNQTGWVAPRPTEVLSLDPTARQLQEIMLPNSILTLDIADTKTDKYAYSYLPSAQQAGELPVMLTVNNRDVVSQMANVYGRFNPSGLPEQPWQKRRRVLINPPLGYQPQSPKEELLWIDTFITIDVGQCEWNVWNYYTDGSCFVADGGEVYASQRGLQLIARQFTRTYPPGIPGSTPGPQSDGYLDHWKLAIFLNNDFAVPMDEELELYCETLMSARQYWPKNAQDVINALFPNQVEKPNLDFRLSCSTWGWIDFESGLSVGFILTNSNAWWYQEVLPVAWDAFTGNTGQCVFLEAGFAAGQNVTNPQFDYKNYALSVSTNSIPELTWWVGTVPVNKICTKFGQPVNPNDGIYLFQGEPMGFPPPRAVTIQYSLKTYFDGITPNSTSRAGATNRALIKLVSEPYLQFANQNINSENAPVDQVQFGYPATNPYNARVWGQGAGLNARWLQVMRRLKPGRVNNFQPNQLTTLTPNTMTVSPGVNVN